jgi:hypothetical protein
MGWKLCGRQSHLTVPVLGHKTCLPLIPLQSSLPSLALTVLFCVTGNQLMLPLLILLLPVGTETMNILPNPGYWLFSLTEIQSLDLVGKPRIETRVQFPGQLS